MSVKVVNYVDQSLIESMNAKAASRAAAAEAASQAAVAASSAASGASSTESFSEVLKEQSDDDGNGSSSSSSGSSSTISCPDDLEPIFAEAAATYGVSEELLMAVAKAESNFNPNAVSRCGAIGVMQLMPGTAASLGVTDSYDAYQNIMGGAKLLYELLDKYDGDVSLALAAYNAGSGNVDRYGGIPPFAETQNYVAKIQSYLGGSFETVSSRWSSRSAADVADEAASTDSSSATTEAISALEDLLGYWRSTGSLQSSLLGSLTSPDATAEENAELIAAEIEAEMAEAVLSDDETHETEDASSSGSSAAEDAASSNTVSGDNVGDGTAAIEGGAIQISAAPETDNAPEANEEAAAEANLSVDTGNSDQSGENEGEENRSAAATSAVSSVTAAPAVDFSAVENAAAASNAGAAAETGSVTATNAAGEDMAGEDL